MPRPSAVGGRIERILAEGISQPLSDVIENLSDLLSIPATGIRKEASINTASPQPFDIVVVHVRRRRHPRPTRLEPAPGSRLGIVRNERADEPPVDVPVDRQLQSGAKLRDMGLRGWRRTEGATAALRAHVQLTSAMLRTSAEQRGDPRSLN